MKKVIGLAFVLCLLLTVGCGNKLSKKEEAMKELAIDYYNNYQKGTVGLTNPTVSIGQLKHANEIINAGYDLSKLDGCEDDSSVELKINDSKEVTDVTFNMNCK